MYVFRIALLRVGTTPTTCVYNMQSTAYWHSTPQAENTGSSGSKGWDK